MRQFYSFLVISLVMSSIVVQAASPVVASLRDDPACRYPSEVCDLAGLRLGVYSRVNENTGLTLGIANFAEGESRGVELGVANFDAAGFKGLQLGIFQEVKGVFHGLQAGWFSIVRNDFYGLQFGVVAFDRGIF